MQNSEVVNNIASTQPWFWYSKMLWSIVILFVLGALARALVSNEPFDFRKFTGEIIISAIGAIIMYSLGLMQGMNEIQIVGFGALASLGGLRSIEWTLKLVNKVKSVQGIGDE